MDALAGFLDGPKARSAFLVRAVMEAPWSMSIEDEAPIAVVAFLSGEAWLDRRDGSPPLHMGAGDLLIARGPDHYVVSSVSGLEPGIRIDKPGNCVSLDGTSLAESMSLGVRTWGNSADGSDVFVVGNYQTDGEVSRWLLESLPPFIVLRSAEWESPVLGLLTDEMARDQPGQQVVLDRLLDVLLVSALRASFAGGAVDVPAWFSAHSDEIVGPVLRMMQNEPGEPWTVATLASAVGVSRALLARRFHELVGQPPMAFLTSWRMALAADLLVAPDATVTSVSRAVGYGSPFTFSTAFKRVYGCSPRDHRDRELASRSEAIG